MDLESTEAVPLTEECEAGETRYFQLKCIGRTG